MIADRSQPPSAEHPMGVAACGTPIVEGLIVFTNEFRPGRVKRYSYTDAVSRDGWFTVSYPDGGGPLQNATRVATKFLNYDRIWEYAKPAYEERLTKAHPELTTIICSECGTGVFIPGTPFADCNTCESKGLAERDFQPDDGQSIVWFSDVLHVRDDRMFATDTEED